MSALPTSFAVDMPAEFDPARYIADMRNAGVRLTASMPVPLGEGGPCRPGTFFITPGEAPGSLRAAGVINEKWSEAMGRRPDWVDAVCRALLRKVPV